MTDLRKKRTNLMITKSFTKLLEEKSFSKITVAEIVKNAMIHRNTFYQHFEDKYALLRCCIENMVSISVFSSEGFKTKPFTTINQYIIKKHLNIVKRQKNDQEFQHTVNNIMLSALSRKSSDDEIFWLIGKIAAIFVWNDVTNHHYEIIHDYEKLDHIFATKKFPK